MNCACGGVVGNGHDCPMEIEVERATGAPASPRCVAAVFGPVMPPVTIVPADPRDRPLGDRMIDCASLARDPDWWDNAPCGWPWHLAWNLAIGALLRTASIAGRRELLRGMVLA